MKPAIAYLLILLLCLPSLSLRAHDARPLSIVITEQSAATRQSAATGQSAALYRVVVRAPPTLPAQDAPLLLWPERCELLESAPLALSVGSTSLVRCSNGIEGAELELRYPGFNPSLTTLVRLDTLDGESITEVLPPEITRWSVAAKPAFMQIAGQYTVLGFQHILEGLDHLLFVAGLLLLAKQPRRIILAVTGFTLAHSLTLALATFELVQLPVDLVEVLIALSVVFLAAEVARGDASTLSQRYPILIAFVFGLLHGFGFASVLDEISLPTQALVQGLLFFNVGVELGQLAFICVCLLLWRGFVVLRTRLALHAAHWQDSALLHSGAYFVGIPAAYWFIERLLPVLS